ncbi:hypothetical protein AYI69_g5100 [Smittium culicis]|uniref:Major facilitator superfamily (MFS) profile domain-containing protein n=1 Tax=Smittium culicis TaxID=133412 RepID=A0A1R1Y8D5_9FUNG|nr:hypothetical protein AYI69_g5100 [Smittium culicis]
MWAVIIAYAISSIGSIGLITVTNIIILEALPPKKRGFYFSASTLIHSLGSIVGPLIAPVIVPVYDYRALFILFLALSAVGWGLCLFALYKSNDSKVHLFFQEKPL